MVLSSLSKRTISSCSPVLPSLFPCCMLYLPISNKIIYIFMNVCINYLLMHFLLLLSGSLLECKIHRGMHFCIFFIIVSPSPGRMLGHSKYLINICRINELVSFLFLIDESSIYLFNLHIHIYLTPYFWVTCRPWITLCTSRVGMISYGFILVEMGKLFPQMPKHTSLSLITDISHSLQRVMIRLKYK